MRKEIFFAIASGILFGLIIAFAIWRANTSIKPVGVKDTKMEVVETTPTPSFGVTIAKPEQNEVVTKTPAFISGVTKPNAIVVFSGETSDYLVYSDANGSFSENVGLLGGANEILVSSFDNQGAEVQEKLLLVYSSEFELPEEKTGDQAEAEEKMSTESSNEIREKVQEKINQAQFQPRAYIGTVTDISESTLQINKFTSAKPQEAGSEIQQVSVNKDAVFIQTGKTAKTVKLSDLAIGDFIIAMGLKNGNAVLEASRILITNAIVPASRKAVFGLVKEAKKDSLIINLKQTGDEQTVKQAEKGFVFLVKDGKMTKIKFSDIDEEDTLMAVGITKNYFEARTIFVISPATAESNPTVTPRPTTSPSPSPES